MAIHASARQSNLERSLHKYIQDTLQGSTGIPTDFPAANIKWPHEAQDFSDQDYALRVSPLRDGGERYYAAAGDGTPGSLRSVVLFLDVFVKREYARQANNLHLIHDAVDLVKGAFPGDLGVTVKNYQGDGATTLGKLWLRDRQKNEPRDAAWLTGGWMLTFQWEETDTA